MESAEKRAAELTESMIGCVRLATGGSGIREDLIPGARVSALIPSDEVYTCLMSPVVGVLLSGEKTLLTESGSITYGGGSCYLIGMEKTGSFLFRADDTGQPLQSVSVMLDAQLLRELLAKVPARPQAGGFEGKKLGTYQVRKAPLYLLEAFARLADLVRHPEDAEVMAPLIIREIHYRLVTGPWRDSIAEIFGQGSSVSRLAKSIRWMTDHYSESFDLGKVAEMAHMSPATFNRHFRALMQESPLQYKRRTKAMQGDRRTSGNKLQIEGYGPHMERRWEKVPEDVSPVHKLLADNCFGDYYARPSTLTWQEREFFTFDMLAACAFAPAQARSHAAGSVRCGVTRAKLLGALWVMLPWVGYPTTLNAVSAVNEATKKA